MKKTLVLVVDRDDDFGSKAKVQSPVIGAEDCTLAATALGLADAEDSDLNAIFAALNIYEDLKNRKNDVEVALICGDSKVGYRSDRAIIDELEEVLATVNPASIILVGDGAEDENVYPIISSRINIDSVKKVYVKQAPGLEGAVYIMSKMMSDPGKRRRFFGPLSWLVSLIASVYLIQSIFKMINESSDFAGTTALIVFLIGTAMLLYSYNISDRLGIWKQNWTKKMKSGSFSLSFTLISVFFIIAGLIYGLYAQDTTYMFNNSQRIIWFFYSVLWFIVFAFQIYNVGQILDCYMDSKPVSISSIMYSFNFLSMGLIVMGAADFILGYFNLNIYSNTIALIEVVCGIVIAFFGINLQRYIKSNISTIVEKDESNVL